MNLSILFGVVAQLRQFRQRDRWTREHLEAYQETAVRQLRADVYARSPFYQQFHHGLMDRPLQELPVLTKALMMEHFDDLVTDRAIRLAAVRTHTQRLRSDERFLDRYWVTATSGSTGHPGLFLFDRAEWTTALASFARARTMAGLGVNLTQRVKTAFVASSSPFHMSARAGATLDSWWMPALRLAASNSLDGTVARLNAFQPDVLVSYASMARVLVEEQRAGRLHIAPRRVFTSSEVLTDDTRRRVEAAWGPTLFNEYSATETGTLAAECMCHRGLHLFEDLVIVEVVDHDNRPVPPGVYGDKLLLTVLFNRTQPLIRYELDDSVQVAAVSCPCGLPYRLIDSIQGRTEDVLHFPATNGGDVAVQPNVFHHVMDTVPAKEWQVLQQADGLSVLLGGTPEGFMDDTLVDALRHALQKQGATVPFLTVRHVPSIPRSAAGKAPLIRSMSSGPAA